MVVLNLMKAWKKWARLLSILGWEGSKMRVPEIFFKVLVQAVLLFGSYTWAMTPFMGRDLGGFQNRMAQRTMVIYLWRLQDGSWEYPTLYKAMQEADFEEVEAYVLMRRNTVVQYITMRPILDLFEETVQRTLACVSKWW